MNRERALWIAVVMFLLVAGLLLGQRVTSPGASDQESFRPWFWQNRGLDLLVQAGLIFAGALGIAALLPRERENDDE